MIELPPGAPRFRQPADAPSTSTPAKSDQGRVPRLPARPCRSWRSSRDSPASPRRSSSGPTRCSATRASRSSPSEAIACRRHRHPRRVTAAAQPVPARSAPPAPARPQARARRLGSGGLRPRLPALHRQGLARRPADQPSRSPWSDGRRTTRPMTPPVPTPVAATPRLRKGSRQAGDRPRADPFLKLSTALVASGIPIFIGRLPPGSRAATAIRTAA